MRVHISKYIATILLLCGVCFAGGDINATVPEETKNNNSDVPWIPPSEEPLENSKSLSEANTAQIDGRIGFQMELYRQYFSYDIPFSAEPTKGSSEIVRGVFDYRHAGQLSTNTQYTISNRFDSLSLIDGFEPIADPQKNKNTLREAYISYAIRGGKHTAYLDIGRVNVRNGVGMGYNPTDYFKDSAVVISTSRDPGALRFNRLGVVMTSLQHIRNWGSASIAAIPKLKSRNEYFDIQQGSDTFDLGLDRTNDNSALYLKFAPKINERFSIDLVTYAEKDSKPEVGVNITSLIFDSLVANFEASVLEDCALPDPGEMFGEKKWYTRAAANIVWTTTIGIELTTEIHYAGDALERNAWDSYRYSTDSDVIAQLIDIQTERSLQQEPLIRSGYFLHASSRNAFNIIGLSISGFVNGNFYDNSNLWQLSVSRSVKNFSFGGIVSGLEGSPTTEYGGSSLKHYAALFMAVYF